jgi:excisionase family DNA binding protein
MKPKSVTKILREAPFEEIAGTKQMKGEVLTFPEACEFLRFKRSRLYAEVFAKRIPHFKIGSSLRFSRQQLQDWLSSHQRGGAQ